MLYLEDHPYLAPFDGSFRHDRATTAPPEGVGSKKQLKSSLGELAERLDDQQRMLYAQDRYSVLLIFQALDAAGKDSTIRAVFNRIDPNGIMVHPFKAPSSLELEHDFLWRSSLVLPRRGNIAIFNRSYYEETLIVRVHPQYLGPQRIPPYESLDALWEQRFESIRDHEKHLTQSGTVVVKFWLKHSREVQRQRFLSRLTEPEKNWKFAESDVKESQHWDAYMDAYEATVNATSRPWAPWYVIPADDKPYMRLTVAEIVSRTLDEMDLHYPNVSDERRNELKVMQADLESKQY